MGTWTATFDFNGRKYKSEANLLPYVAAAYGTSLALKHIAPAPWRHVPTSAVWLGFGALMVALSFDRVPEQ